MTDLGLFRLYNRALDPFDIDGYPVAWQQIKHLIRTLAGDRCERCNHPYVNGLKLNEGWSACDDRCAHLGPMRVWTTEGWTDFEPSSTLACGPAIHALGKAEARWRILTTHHLTGDKADCRWWNLAALCQRCHLTIQGRVVMDREFIREHTDWMKPHAAGFYAMKYLGADLTRDETMARLDELLALEFRAEALF